MQAADIGPFDEVFTHVEDVTGKQTLYAVDPLFKRCLQGDIPLVKIPVEEVHARYCMENRGVEHERLGLLVAQPEYLKKPIMFIEMPEGKNAENSHLLVDGTHRYVAFFALGLPEIAAYIIPWAVASEFIVEGVPPIPEKVLMTDSRLTAMRAMRQLFDMTKAES